MHPSYPIIYVRGYAGTQNEVEDTVATPYMGFNLGSTKLRQHHSGTIESHIFESPLVRLIKEEGYIDAYRDGEALPRGPVAARSIWIFRYYDITSQDLGQNARKEIEFHAAQLREFIRHIKDATAEDWPAGVPFRVNLVAHSMGGLVCRCYLQNQAIPGLDGRPATAWTDKAVDKFFTYATPHGGIEFRRGLGWVSGFRDFLDINNSANFGPERMRAFLDLPQDQPLNSVPDRCLPAERIFCMVGTDAHDYAAAGGLSRRSVGPLSDGLVQIENATVKGAARAFVYRSHSGHYGIVNSESSYQNLVRFLFGDIRVEGRLLVDELTLPPAIRRAHAQGDKIRASYHFETVLRVRGARWDLSRRLVDEHSAIFRSFDDMMRRDRPRHPHLFTSFLARDRRRNRRRRSLGFSVDLAVRVPDYEVENRFWFDDHYDGGFLFRDKINLDLTPRDQGSWSLRYGFDSRTPNRATTRITGNEQNGAVVFELPLRSRTEPGLSARLQLTCSRWNTG